MHDINCDAIVYIHSVASMYHVYAMHKLHGSAVLVDDIKIIDVSFAYK